MGHLILSGTTLGSISRMGTGAEIFAAPRNVEEVCMLNKGKEDLEDVGSSLHIPEEKQYSQRRNVSCLALRQYIFFPRWHISL